MVKTHPTKRAPDVWESARFRSIFLASSFFCSQALSMPAHTQVTQSVGRWVMKANMNKFLKIIPLVIVALLFSGCAQTPQRSREAEESRIYSLLMKEGCKEKMDWTLPPTLILGETYYDSGFEDESVLRKEPSINQETLDDYRAIGQEKQILDRVLISNNESCDFISSEKLDSSLKEDYDWFNKHMLISFSKIGFNKNFDQAIVYRQYDCGGECSGNDLYILIRQDDLWSIKTIIGGWRS